MIASSSSGSTISATRRTISDKVTGGGSVGTRALLQFPRGFRSPPHGRPLLAGRNARLEFRHPRRVVPIGGRAPIRARRQRPAGADLGRVGQRRALELAGLEETGDENAQAGAG